MLWHRAAILVGEAIRVPSAQKRHKRGQGVGAKDLKHNLGISHLAPSHPLRFLSLECFVFSGSVHLIH